MENQSQQKLLPKKIILTSGAIFVISFFVFLGAWILVKGYYGSAVTTVASYAAASVKNAKVVDIARTDDIVHVSFIPKTFGVAQVYKATIDVPVSNYGFNVPLTLAIMAAFFPFLKSRKVYFEVLIILILVHFLFVFTLEGERLTGVFVSHGYEKESTISNIFWQFSWGFLDNMVVRFEPFLIGAYLFFFRNRQAAVNSKPVKDKSGKENKGKYSKRSSKSKGKKRR